MRNYFAIQRLRTVFNFSIGGGTSRSTPLDFYEIDFSGEAQEALDAYMDYYNIEQKQIIGDESYYDDSLYFELDREIVIQLLNVTSFPQLRWDSSYLQKTSPRYIWSNNK
jgi:hypothetical protein